MGRRDDTDIGGSESFQATNWDQVRKARADGHEARQAANDIIAVCWKPIYAYLRRGGLGNEEAKDLTQKFFQEVVLGRRMIQRADRKKGKFRSYLLRALNRFVRSEHRNDFAKKRRPPGGVMSLDVADRPDAAQAPQDSSPEAAFHRAWVAEILERVVAEVEGDCRRDGLAVHWTLFEARVLLPLMGGREARSIPSLCAELGLENASRASNMIVTVKRRLRERLVSVLAPSLDLSTSPDDEIDELLRLLSGDGAS